MLTNKIELALWLVFLLALSTLTRAQTKFRMYLVNVYPGLSHGDRSRVVVYYDLYGLSLN